MYKHFLITLVFAAAAIFQSPTALAQFGDSSQRAYDDLPRAISVVPSNWGVVEKDKVYRSSQPLFDQLSNARQKYGLKSILILQGGQKEHIDAEIKEAQENGMTYLQVPISAKSFLSDEDLFKIVKFLNDAPRPLLIHCRAGADRTGLISAIYRNFFMGQEFHKAKRRMLSIRWGHLWFGPTQAMDKYYLEVYPTKIEELKRVVGRP